MDTTFTKTWRVYGAEGHRQRESFRPSFRWDFSNERNGIRIIEGRAFDKTGTHDYLEIIITRATEKLCDEELEGQVSDGVFENARVGKIEVC